MTAAALIIIGVFVVLLLGRVAGARRALWLRHTPAILTAGGAVILLLRGQIQLAIALTIAAAALWYWTERPRQAQPQPARAGMTEAEARAILGVGPSADEAEIRAAFRARIKRAHPDRGGSHEETARLNAARAVLLHKR